MGSLLGEATFLGTAVTNSRSVLEDVDVETNLLLGAVRAEESAVGDSDLELSALEFFCTDCSRNLSSSCCCSSSPSCCIIVFMHQKGNLERELS